MRIEIGKSRIQQSENRFKFSLCTKSNWSCGESGYCDRSLPFGKLRVGISEKNSIHPSAGAAAILFVLVIGRTEIAILVKVIFGVLIMLFHINLEFFPGTAALPKVITILESIASL
jgi:hypothetical protein